MRVDKRTKPAREIRFDAMLPERVVAQEGARRQKVHRKLRIAVCARFAAVGAWPTVPVPADRPTRHRADGRRNLVQLGIDVRGARVRLACAHRARRGLVGVRGIGPGTGQLYLLFRLGRLNVMAPADLGLQEGLRILDGLDERPSPQALAAGAEDWAPLCSLACWTRWRLADEAKA